MRRIRLFCISFAFVMLWGVLFGSAGAAQVYSAPLTTVSDAQNGMVRVLLSSMNYPSALDVTIAGSYTAVGEKRVVLSSGDKVQIAFNKNTGDITMTVRGVSYAMGKDVTLRRHQTDGQSGMKIAQTKMPENLYPGDLQLKAQLNGGVYRMYPIVHVYIEYYLHGVVPYEMGNSAHLEALKAQAVAARTYTLNKMNSRTGALYDVVDTTYDQVYYGNSDSTTRCTQAVNETKGIVLMNNGELTGTYYTASNGGQTESAVNLWGSSGFGYLSVKDDPFDTMNTASVQRKITVYADNTQSGQNEALKNLLHSKLQSVLQSYGYSASGVSVKNIRSITPHTPKYPAPSRLYTKLDFEVTAQTNTGTVNATLTFDIFSELEKALGMSINTSHNELWSVEKSGNTYVIYARRFGHGIGMSQRGAMQMGSLGYTYDQILGFYYEGCKRVQHTFTHTVLSSVESGGEIIITTEKPAEITSGAGITAIVKLVGVSDKLAVRDAASPKGKILTSVINGGLVNVIAKLDDWTMIQLGSIVGYVPTSALRFNGEPPLATDKTPTRISQWATVRCSGTLNLRADGSSKGSVITSMPNGSVLCVFAVTNGWAQVQYGAVTGWCSLDFLEMSDAYPGKTADQINGAAAIVIPSGKSTVNLRETPSTSARVLATLANGTQITVTTSDGSWCSVTTADGTKGYVMASYVSFGAGNGLPESSPEKPPVEEPELGDGELEAVVHTVSSSLNLREQPNTQSRILASLPRGESIVVTKRGSTWSAVRYGSQHGYVMTQYLRFPADEESGAGVIGYARVNTQSGSLNMRMKPSLSSTVVMQIPKGTRVSIVQQLDGWCKIMHAGIDGYVMQSYLAMEGDDQNDNVHQTATVVTPGGPLNLRQSPASTSGVLASIPEGTTVQVVTQGSEWCKIVYGNIRGYVMTKYLEFEKSDAGGNVPQGSTVRVKTGNGGLNLRETASASARVLLIIPDETVLSCIAYGSEWTHVLYGETKGYVMTRFLVVDDAAQPENNGGNQGNQSNGTQSVQVKTGGGGLNLRLSASTTAQVLTSIPNGEAVTLLEWGDEWCRVRYKEQEGYVMTRYLAREKDNVASENTAWIDSSISGGVNLRFAPDTSAQVLAVLAPGTQVSVTMKGATWSVVRYESHVGYVMSRYLTYTQEPQALQPDTQPGTQPVFDPSLYSLSGWEAVVTVAEGNVNLRAWCDTNAPVRMAIPKDSVVRLVEFGDDWCHVVYGEVEGYCMTKYLSPRIME